MTVNSFTSLSLEPPLVLVCIAKAANAHDKLGERSFCVNVLGAEQEALARRFAGGDADVLPRFAEGGHAPRLEGALAYMGSRFTTIAEPETGVEYLI